MGKLLCLVCDEEPVVEISAVTGDAVGLCLCHWRRYAAAPDGLVGQMIDKYFGDCGEMWQERAGRRTEWLDRPELRTDEERGRYAAE